jgi:hypothetical protein
MDFRLRNKKADFLNGKTPDLDTIRQVQHSRELTLRRQKKYDIFQKNRENKTDFLYEMLEQDIINKYQNDPRLKFLYDEDLNKKTSETVYKYCFSTLSNCQNEEERIIFLIYLRRIFLSMKSLDNLDNLQELIPLLVSFLETTNNTLIMVEIVWILSIFAAKNSEISAIILDRKNIQVIYNLLYGQISSMVFDHICWLIGNLSSHKNNSILKQMNFFASVLNIFPKFRSEKIEVTILWCLYGLSNAKLYTREERLELILIKTLSKLYLNHSAQEKLFILGILAEISNFSSTPLPIILKYFSEILAINFNKITNDEQEIDISKLTLIILGNITTGENMYIDQMLCKIENFLKTLKSIIRVRNEELILKEVFFILSNFAAGDEKYVEMLFDEVFHEELFCNNYPYKIETEIIWVIANMTNTNKENNIITLLNVGLLRKIEHFLDCKFDAKINILCLEALENLLFKVKSLESKLITDLYQKLLNHIKYQTDLLDKIENLPEIDMIKKVSSKVLSYINDVEL